MIIYIYIYTYVYVHIHLVRHKHTLYIYTHTYTCTCCGMNAQLSACISAHIYLYLYLALALCRLASLSVLYDIHVCTGQRYNLVSFIIACPPQCTGQRYNACLLSCLSIILYRAEIQSVSPIWCISMWSSTMWSPLLSSIVLRDRIETHVRFSVIEHSRQPSTCFLWSTYIHYIIDNIGLHYCNDNHRLVIGRHYCQRRIYLPPTTYKCMHTLWIYAGRYATLCQYVSMSVCMHACMYACM